MGIRVKLYPNPSKGMFYIEPELDCSYEIINSFGQIVQHVKLLKKLKNRCNVLQPAGIYLLKLTALDMVITKRIFINP